MDVYCFAYVEDAPGAAIARKLVTARNVGSDRRLVFRSGFPSVMRGRDAIRSKCDAFLNMAKSGSHTLILTDLDAAECACELIREWFAIPQGDPVDLPSPCIFRVAVKEVESWILADHEAWAGYIGIPAGNFSMRPDQLYNPEGHLLGVHLRLTFVFLIRSLSF